MNSGSYNTILADEITVELPIVEGQYDVSPFFREVRPGKRSQDEPTWFAYGPQVRLGLLLLKQQGMITSYETKNDRIQISFAANATASLTRLLSPPRLLNEEQLHNPARIAIYVHGLEGSATTFAELATALQDDGWFPLKLVYPNDGPIDEPAKFLRQKLLSIHRQLPNSRIIVIAHSLGGLVAWKVLSEAGDVGVTDLFSIGVPFQGSSLARFQQELELIDVFLLALKGKLDAFQILSDGDGEAVEILQPKSPQRARLLALPLPPTTKLHLVAGDGGPLDSNEQERIAEMLEQWISKRQPSPNLARDLRDLIRSPEIYQGRGDGAVTVASATGAPYSNSKRIFSHSHTGLLKTRSEQSEVLLWIKEQLGQRE